MEEGHRAAVGELAEEEVPRGGHAEEGAVRARALVRVRRERRAPEGADLTVTFR